MKKFLFALALGLLLVLALATVAMADNGPHGGFTATTDACAGCHRAHSAKVGSNSLLIMDPEALCLTCHNGSGAATNVVDGVYMAAGSPYGSVEGTDGASLFGGGFTNALMATAWNGSHTFKAGSDATSKATTSTHGVGAAGTVWGSGANNSTNAGMVLECTTCHDPHGKAGFTNATTQTTGCNVTLAASTPLTESCTVKVSSYRLLRWQPQGSGGFTAPATSVNWSGGNFPVSGSTAGWTVPDNYAANGSEWYTIGAQTLTCGTAPNTYACGPFAAGDYNNGNANNTYQPLNAVPATQTYIPAAVNTAYFCAQCHDRYFNNSRLRNNTDESAYCTRIGDVGYVPPVDINSVSAVDATGCLPYYYTGTTAPTPRWLWADVRSSGDTTYMFRHASGDIRLSMDGTSTAGGGTSVSRSCVACHVSHGTTAAMTALAGTADTPAVTPPDGASLAGGSTLLRMDNRSLCLRCHASTVNFTVTP